MYLGPAHRKSRYKQLIPRVGKGDDIMGQFSTLLSEELRREEGYVVNFKGILAVMGTLNTYVDPQPHPNRYSDAIELSHNFINEQQKGNFTFQDSRLYYDVVVTATRQMTNPKSYLL